jgi:hypothetical protein
MLAGGFSLPNGLFTKRFQQRISLRCATNEDISSIGGVTWAIGRDEALLFSDGDQFALVLLYDPEAEFGQ